MVKGAVKLTGKLIEMESQYPLADTIHSIGLVHLLNPKLALHFVDEIDKHIGVHNVRKGLINKDEHLRYTTFVNE
ncbi:unnamed protein product [Aspergillus oryzae]|uniref:Unnamed protein product n=1 Tax=Aspergillus oryzae TaxID=5062 RepID=A0AAN5BYB8_ASPOZ|nr:unnamed protein product [Aspergillus oryzae]GMF89597.1 unnamed protein product [Aspergillus oryzae]GMG10107.1 unnamed protein product [Aspergillus oryzae]GMG30116.1 unnamed protein product [Aspergillus oryzae]